MVGMARRAVPARVVAGRTNIRATLAIEGVAPLHAARTSQRDVPTTLNRYPRRTHGPVGGAPTGAAGAAALPPLYRGIDTICSAHFVASLCRTVRFLAIFDKVIRQSARQRFPHVIRGTSPA